MAKAKAKEKVPTQTKSKSTKADKVKSQVNKKKVLFTFEGETGRDVVVAGSFNGWETTDPKKVKRLKEDAGKTGTYSLSMFLPEGEHEYKFFSEGRWFADPNAQENRLNQYGTFNSIIMA